jgi:hypothetical protein
MAPGRCAPGARGHGGAEVVDQDGWGTAATKRAGVLVAGEAMLHGLGDGARDRHHAARAQDQDTETQRARRWPYGGGAKRPPLALGTLAWGQSEREAGGLTPGAERVDRGFHTGIGAVKALLAQVLEHLRGARGRALKQADDRGLQGIEVTGAVRGWAGAAVLLGAPGGHGARLQGAGAGAQRGTAPV